MRLEPITIECTDSFQTVNNYRVSQLNQIELINKNAETTAKQMILIRSLMGDKCEDVTYLDNLPYPHVEQAKLSKLKLEKWEAQVVLSHYDNLPLDIQSVVKKDLPYLLVKSEVL